MNAMTDAITNEQNKNKNATAISSNRQQKRNERMLRMKEQKFKNKNGNRSTMCDASSLMTGNECATTGST